MTRAGEISLGGAVAAAGLVLLMFVLPREVREVASEVNEVSPAFFPRIFSWLIVGIGSAHVLQHLLGPAAEGSPQVAPGAPLALPTLRVAATLGLGAAYILVLPGIGFIAATVAALAGFVLLFGRGSIWRAGALAVPFAVLLFFVFGELLKTPLPRAGWFD